MKYYKIIVNNEFIGAISSDNFLAVNPTTNWLLTSNEILGQFVECNNVLYRDYWMQPITNNKPYTQANIIEITKEDYDAYIEAIANDEPIIDPSDDPIEDDPIPDPIPSEEDDAFVEYIRASKILEMSNACRRAIESGVDVPLGDGIHHFSLTTQDQLNLMSLSIMAQTQSLIPYHADGEEVTFYTAAEINIIIEATNSHKIYHTTYYNALKAYINTFSTIEEIAAIEYGTPIPDEYKTDALNILEQ